MIRHEFDYDDVLILPHCSKVNHRGDVDLSTHIGGEMFMQYPIMAAPMKGIVGPELITSLGEYGGLGFMHRFYSFDEYYADVPKILTYRFGTAISLKENESVYGEMLNYGSNIICIDVANGYLESVIAKCEEVSNYISSNGYSNAYVMGGCVATIKGCERLYDAGCEFIRVGIGSGQLCTTRNATGIGRPQISALLECGGNSDKYYTVADGGIRNSGDAAKALAAGADFVMMGSWFAQANESENNGVIHGMASASHQIKTNGKTKSVEGISKKAEKVAPLETLLDEFVWNLKSAFTYVGARNICEFQARAEFVEVSTHAIKKDY